MKNLNRIHLGSAKVSKPTIKVASSKLNRYPATLVWIHITDVSNNRFKSWDHIRDLEPDVDFDHEQPNRDKHTNDGDGEYSYPSIQEDGIHDGLIHVPYTFRRETIKYSAFMTDWIKDNSEEAKSIGKVQKIADTFNDAVYTERINGKRNDWEFDVGSDNDGNPKTEYMLPNPEELPPTELPL